jgi:hypothetical protein
VEAVDLVAVVEERRAAGDEQDGAALGQRGAGGGEGAQQRERPLARLDPADGEDGQLGAEARRVAGGRALAGVARRVEALEVDAVGHELRLDAELVAQPRDPRRRDDEHAVGRRDRALLAGDQRRRAEVVDVVDRPHDRVDDALVAQRQRRVGRDAVLRVHDVEAAVAQRPAQPSV